jgi:MFS family permease
LDLSPLRRRDFRLLYLGQFVSFFGSMMSYVALPYVLYQATKSTILIGLLGVVQLVPSVVGGLFGGALADAVDRRKLIVVCELSMAAIALALGLYLSQRALTDAQPGWLLAAAASMAVLNGFHRPALQALMPRLLEKHQMPALGVLSSLRNNVGMIGGPALAGLLISAGGAALTFYIDVATFVICTACVLAIENVPRVERASQFSAAAIAEGFRYALGRQELIGTYLVDIVAMTFSMPNLLFPAVAEAFGGAVYLGWLHAGISLGALLATLTSRWLLGTRRHGAMILAAAGAWSLFMVGFGLCRSFVPAMLCLVLAGYADMVSAVFRQTIWNQTIPDELRGRLAGIEMISYLSGPMLGNTQLGLLSAALGISRAITLSSLVGLAGVLSCARLLPGFRNYLAPDLPREDAPRTTLAEGAAAPALSPSSAAVTPAPNSTKNADR